MLKRDEVGLTPLHLAAQSNKNSVIMEALLDADVQARDNDGKTPLDYAEENESIKETESYWKLQEMQYSIRKL